MEVSKVVLEIGIMPSDCLHCVLSTKKGTDRWLCCGFDLAVELDIFAEQRPDFCPLKEIS